jgi:hypothetical protein
VERVLYHYMRECLGRAAWNQTAWTGQQPLSGWSLTCMLRNVALRVPVATSKSTAVFGAICRFRVGRGGHYNATNTKHNGANGEGGAAAGSGRGQWISSPLSLGLMSAMGCRGCARLAVRAGRLPYRDLQAPLVRLSCWVLLVGRHTAQLGGDARHRHKGQTVKLRGNPEGQRYRPGVATSHGHHVVAWG